MLQREGCEKRLTRLRAAMAERSLDAVALTLPHHVYWASGYRPHWLQQAAVVITADGRSLLVAASPGPSDPFVDEVRPFVAAFRATQRQEQPALVAAAVLDWLSSRSIASFGVDCGQASVDISSQLASTTQSIDPMMWQLRRPKEADELQLMKKAIDCTDKMYRIARTAIRENAPELTVYAMLHHAAVLTAGEPLSDILGNDFACGVGGGPARGKHYAKAGELYILDLGPAYRGYFADNARTFSVDQKPTAVQLKTAAAIDSVFPVIQAEAKPGASCRTLYERVDQHLKDRIGTGLTHHLGHGVGLEPHEYPHLNPEWDDHLIEGEIFTVEPGIYGPDLKGGIRIENQYLVTATGVENLLNFTTSIV